MVCTRRAEIWSQVHTEVAQDRRTGVWASTQEKASPQIRPQALSCPVAQISRETGRALQTHGVSCQLNQVAELRNMFQRSSAKREETQAVWESDLDPQLSARLQKPRNWALLLPTRPQMLCELALIGPQL